MAQTAAPYDHLEELSAQLDALRDEAKALCDDPLRSDARRKLGDRLRSLAACARGIAPIAEALHACQVIVRASAVLGRLDAVDRERLMEAVGRIETCAREYEMTPSSGRAHGRRPNTCGVLRVAMLTGSARLEALRSEDWAADDDRSPVLELTRLSRVSETRAAVSRDKPDVLVIDADIDGAGDCVEKLMSDKATEAIPIVLVGTWRDAGDTASFVAMGVARCLAKPASPSALRRAVLDVAPGWSRSPFQPIGETTLDRLGARLANELQRGLCDAAADGARTRPVDLGDGAEVLSALWDAVARIRQLVTARARGTIRFAAAGPAAALPSAPWLGGSPRVHPDRAAALGEVRRAERAPTLEGHTIVVADDDPSMSWFLSGVLREAGAKVVEAFDGEQALDRVYRTIPDLVMSDIVMPEIDGYTLCRAVKRDVALRSCPVVLLSWKRDLLQRMRELGAEADGYLLKEASAREILQRIHELLSPQRSIARRLAEGAVRGRLDGMSPFALLRTACQLRPDCRVTVRDAHFVFSIEVRQGRPVSATRTADDGGTERGAPVIIGMLGVGDGRFGVEPVDPDLAVPRELSGTLEDQLKHPIAHARAAQQLLRGQRLLAVERVQFDDTALAPQVACTPEPARGLLQALIAGASPRSMIASGSASAELLERVLDDAARRGAVRVVMDERGEDLLLAGFERELAIVEGRGDRSAWRELAQASRSEEAPALWEETDESAEPLSNTPSDEVVVVDNRILDVRTPSPPPPVVKPRLPDRHATTPLQASAVVSEGARHHTPILSSAVTSPARLAELDPSPVPEQRAAEQVEARDQTPTERKVQKRRRRRQEESPAAAVVVAEPRAPLLPSAYVTRPREPEPEPRRHRWLLPIVFGTAGIALAVGARWMREHRPAQPTMEPPPMEAPAAEPPRAEKADEPEAPVSEEPPEELPLSGEDKARLRGGQALLEIVVGRQDQVFVDGKDAGRGPVVKLAIDAGEAPHEIRAKLRGEERVRYVTVRAGTRVRVRVAPPWSR